MTKIVVNISLIASSLDSIDDEYYDNVKKSINNFVSVFIIDDKKMSKGNSEVAHVLLKVQKREDESIRLRKQILKSNSFAITNTDNNNNLFDYITESNTKYVDRIKNLQQFKNKSKAKTRNLSEKMDWMREQSSLQKLSYNLQRDIAIILESILIQTPADHSIIELVDLDNDNSNNQKENFRQMKSQLSDIKRMMADTLKSIRKYDNDNNDNNNENNNNDDKNNSENNNDNNIYTQAVALFADILLRVKQAHTNTYIELKVLLSLF